MTIDELFDLPVTMPLATAARAYGIGRTRAYELHDRGEFPVPVQRIGTHQLIVRRADLLRDLGVGGPGPTGGETGTPSPT